MDVTEVFRSDIPSTRRRDLYGAIGYGSHLGRGEKWGFAQRMYLRGAFLAASLRCTFPLQIFALRSNRKGHTIVQVAFVIQQINCFGPAFPRPRRVKGLDQVFGIVA